SIGGLSIMRKNIGTVDASIRITAGLLGLAYGIGKMSRRPYRAPWLLMTLSAMKVAEGFTRFCPMLYAMRGDTHSQDGMQAMWGRMVSTGDKMVQSMPMPTLAKMAGAFMGMGGAKQSSAGSNDQEQKQRESSPQMETAGDTARQEAPGRNLSASDQQLEKEIGEHITSQGLDDERRPRHSANYSHDEYDYPTYS
ncbi:DUF2892 domain-containing protein, partial [Microbacteriaceae bacterium K1510]|nr:DUF2892 domain-containing protein [Frankia sp. Cpl3]MCK9910750.1 DUF2892 domain-containing protein [Microbacteriaceae bacterium K1510]